MYIQNKCAFRNEKDICGASKLIEEMRFKWFSWGLRRHRVVGHLALGIELVNSTWTVSMELPVRKKGETLSKFTLP